jgi:hypothetical protein
MFFQSTYIELPTKKVEIMPSGCQPVVRAQNIGLAFFGGACMIISEGIPGNFRERSLVHKRMMIHEIGVLILDESVKTGKEQIVEQLTVSKFRYLAL